MSPLQVYLNDYEGTLKRNSMSANWPRDDCLNHDADRVAICQVDFDTDGEYELIV